MNKPTVILLSGHAGCGKDFVANILKEQLEKCNKKVLITHYADLLKYICKTFFNWNGEKDEFGRSLLQYVGTDVVREVNPNYWVDFIDGIIYMFYDKWDYILIPDARFPNEITEMKRSNFYSTISIRVNRPGYETHLTKEQQAHHSETALDDFNFDIYIDNTTKESVKKQIENFIKFDLKININKPTVFIDLDGVVLNTIKCIVNLYNEDFKYYPKYEKVDWTDVDSWDFTELKAAKPEYINHYFNQKRFFDNVEMFESAKKVIDKLSEKYNIKFVSLGYAPNLLLKDEWVKDNFPYAEFIGVDMKYYKDKSHIDMSGDGNVFIDDRSDNLETSNVPIKICFGDCYDWNTDWISDDKCTFDAFKWNEIEWLFNEFNKK